MPNELTPHRSAQEFLPPSDEYARIVDLATRLSGTEFVPSALRGDRGEANPAAVLAAMLTGREEGLEPMESLRSVHMIEGRPTLSAEAMMKLAMRGGHLLIVTETTRERATVKYRHAEWPEDEPAREISFDLEDAELAGLTGRAMYRKYPRAMLRSRAITEACRAGGLLGSAGIAYTAEEITDEDDDVEEAVIVESISPEPAEEDELEERRDLYARAADAYRAIKRADETLAGNAWAQATTGLGANAWTDGDLDVLRLRVDEIERIAADLPEDGDDEPQEPEGDDGPDGGTDGPEDDRGPESATQSDGEDVEPEPEIIEAEVIDDVEIVEEPEPAPVPEDVHPNTPDADVAEADSWVDAQVEDAIEDAPDDVEAIHDLEEHYGDLTVADVSTLLRKGSVGIETADGDALTLELPRSAPGGVLAAYELVEALEAAEHGNADSPEGRKTVKGALESAGWTPAGKRNLAEARQEAASARGTGQETSDGEAEALAPDDAPAPETATQSDGEIEPEESIAFRRRMLSRWKRAHRDLEAISKPRARRVEVERLNSGLGDDDAWLGEDVETLARVVSNAERVLAVARRDASNPAIGDAR